MAPVAVVMPLKSGAMVPPVDTIVSVPLFATVCVVPVNWLSLTSSVSPVLTAVGRMTVPMIPVRSTVWPDVTASAPRFGGAQPPTVPSIVILPEPAIDSVDRIELTSAIRLLPLSRIPLSRASVVVMLGLRLASLRSVPPSSDRLTATLLAIPLRLTPRRGSGVGE